MPDPLLLTPTDVAGSAELATQTALDLLLNMSTQRELATGSLKVRSAEGGLCLLGVAGRGFPALFCFRECLARPLPSSS